MWAATSKQQQLVLTNPRLLLLSSGSCIVHYHSRDYPGALRKPWLRQPRCHRVITTGKSAEAYLSYAFCLLGCVISPYLVCLTYRGTTVSPSRRGVLNDDATQVLNTLPTNPKTAAATPCLPLSLSQSAVLSRPLQRDGENSHTSARRATAFLTPRCAASFSPTSNRKGHNTIRPNRSYDKTTTKQNS